MNCGPSFITQIYTYINEAHTPPTKSEIADFFQTPQMSETGIPMMHIQKMVPTKWATKYLTS
jgi:hypothetical protein